MDWLVDAVPILAAAGSFLVVVVLARFAWRLRQRERWRNERLLNSVHNQQERRRRGE